MLKLLHCSDLHLSTTPLSWSWRDCFNKRLPGWINVRLLGRGARFASADLVVRRLQVEIQQRQPDAVIFSGDASHFGFAEEIEHTARQLGLGTSDGTSIAGVAVPGNHDYYVAAAANSGAFERCFAPWQQGVRLDNRPYPFALRLGSLWLIAVQAARPHRAFWQASGMVGPQQWQDLEQLCRRLDPGPRIAVCHYPLLTEHRRPEPRYRRLRDWRIACQMVKTCGIALWLHGHRHHWYWLTAGDILPCPTIGAGSATQSGCAGYLEYRIQGQTLHAYRRRYDPASDAFVDEQSFTLPLVQPATPSHSP